MALYRMADELARNKKQQNRRKVTHMEKKIMVETEKRQ
jgi:hypothetical protein